MDGWRQEIERVERVRAFRFRMFATPTATPPHAPPYAPPSPLTQSRPPPGWGLVRAEIAHISLGMKKRAVL